MCKTPDSDAICACSQFLGKAFDRSWVHHEFTCMKDLSSLALKDAQKRIWRKFRRLVFKVPSIWKGKCMEPLSPKRWTSGVTKSVATAHFLYPTTVVRFSFWSRTGGNFRNFIAFWRSSPWHAWRVDLASWWPYRWPRSTWISSPRCAGRRRWRAPSSAGRPRPSGPAPAPRRPAADGPWAAATRRSWDRWRKKLLGGLWIPTVTWTRLSHDSRDKVMRTCGWGKRFWQCRQFIPLINLSSICIYLLKMCKVNMFKLFKCLGLIGSSAWCTCYCNGLVNEIRCGRNDLLEDPKRLWPGTEWVRTKWVV